MISIADEQEPAAAVVFSSSSHFPSDFSSSIINWRLIDRCSKGVVGTKDGVDNNLSGGGGGGPSSGGARGVFLGISDIVL